jgi:hypothetical protein
MKIESKLLSGSLFSLTLGLVLLCSSQAYAQSPPLITDDPGTPGDGRWEVNIVSSLEKTRFSRSIEAPLFDINYGVGEHLQLKVEFPWLVLRGSEEETRKGFGSTNVGVKWRFLDEEKHGIDMSVYPQFEFKNTLEATEDEPASGPQFLLPVQVLRKVGPVEMVGEVGYSFVKNGPNQTIYGVAAGRDVSKRVELLGEIFGTSENHFHDNVLVFNVGSIVQLSKKANLVFAVGRSIVHEAEEGPAFLATVGIQFNFRAPLWGARSASKGEETTPD